MTQDVQNRPPFDPTQVPINYTLNFHQVNLILKGMSKLPREESEGFYEQFRGVALQTLQVAEGEYKAQQEAVDAPKNPDAPKAPEAPAA